MTQTDKKKNDLHKICKRRRKPWNLPARSLVILTAALIPPLFPLREFLPNRDSLLLCPIPNSQSGSVIWRTEEGRGTSWHGQ